MLKRKSRQLYVLTAFWLFLFLHHLTSNKSILNLNVDVSQNIRNYIDNSCLKLKIFIPSTFGREFNTDFEDKIIEKCWHIDRYNLGHGWLRHTDTVTNIGQFATDQYSTDLLFYNRIRHDKELLVDDIRDANVIYIPFMMGCACSKFTFELGKAEDYRASFENVGVWLQENEQLIGDKVVLLINSRVEVELYRPYCKPENHTVKILNKFNVHMYSVEATVSLNRTMAYSFSTMPYATFTKFIYEPGKHDYTYDFTDDRDIDLLFTGGKRGNIYRKTITENLLIKTELNYTAFKMRQSSVFKNSLDSLSVFLHFKGCDIAEDLFKSYTWKIHSKFCLEPFGDTPSRRSLWDSIMLGCVPVIFTPLDLPFSDVIDYDKFVLQFNLTHILDVKENRTHLHELFKPYMMNDKWLKQARSYISKIRQFIQFTWLYNEKGNITDSNFRYDAYGMLLARVASRLRL